MRLLFLGDLVGRSGRTAVIDRLPDLVADHELDFVVVNGENAAGGFGITEDILRSVLAAGADAVTTGNHAFDQRQALVFSERHGQFVRPINFPAGSPGRGSVLRNARNGAPSPSVTLPGLPISSSNSPAETPSPLPNFFANSSISLT